MKTQKEFVKVTADLKRSARMLALMINASVHACPEHKRIARRVIELDRESGELLRRGNR